MRTQQEVLLPGPPSNLTARPTSAFSILVSWDPPSQHQEDVLKYKLYHRHGVSWPPYLVLSSDLMVAITTTEDKPRPWLWAL